MAIAPFDYVKGCATAVPSDRREPSRGGATFYFLISLSPPSRNHTIGKPPYHTPLIISKLAPENVSLLYKGYYSAT